MLEIEIKVWKKSIKKYNTCFEIKLKNCAFMKYNLIFFTSTVIHPGSLLSLSCFSVYIADR